MMRIQAKCNNDAARTPSILDKTVAHKDLDEQNKIVSDLNCSPNS